MSAHPSSQRVALVTGAGNGLGAAFAQALAEDGCALIVNNRAHAELPSSAHAVAGAITAQGGAAIADTHAVDAPGAAEAIVKDAISAYGRLDILVVNAGITGPAMKVGSGDTELAAVMAINFFANARLVEAALPLLLAGPAGRIIFISSSAALYGVRGRSAYAASKGALNAYALTLADELRRTPTRVNIVAPYAATKMTKAEGEAGNPLLDPVNAAAIIVQLARPDMDRAGDIWVSGAGHVRPARIMEGRGGPATGNALSDRLDALAAMDGARAFDGAEAAFADFFESRIR